MLLGEDSTFSYSHVSGCHPLIALESRIYARYHRLIYHPPTNAFLYRPVLRQFLIVFSSTYPNKYLAMIPRVYNYIVDKLTYVLTITGLWRLGLARQELRDNRVVVKRCVSCRGLDLMFASARLKNDREVVMAAVKENGISLSHASAELRNDKEIVMTAIENSGSKRAKMWSHVSPMVYNKHRLHYTSPMVHNGHRSHILIPNDLACPFASASDILRDDKEVAIAAIESAVNSVRFISERLAGDRDIATISVRKYGLMLEYVSADLRNDQDVVLDAVRDNGLALQFASDDIRDKEYVVLNAVRENGLALQFASERIRGDGQVTTLALKQNGRALEFASYELRDREDIVMAALEQDTNAIEFASERIQDMVNGLKYEASALEKLNELKKMSCAKSAKACL